MATTLVLNPLTPPPGTCIPGTAEGLLAFSAQYLQIVQRSASLTSTSVLYGNATPDVTDQDKPWYRTTTDGVAIGWYYYFNGKWVRSADFPVGTIFSFNGSSALFDSSGKGIPGTSTDGYFLCNGSNGTPNLTDKFIVGGGRYVNGAWLTDVDPAARAVSSGGRDRVVLNLGNLPALSADFAAGTAAGNSTQAFVRGNQPSGDHIVDTITPGNNDPLFPIPPFYAFAYIIWLPNA